MLWAVCRWIYSPSDSLPQFFSVVSHLRLLVKNRQWSPVVSKAEHTSKADPSAFIAVKNSPQPNAYVNATIKRNAVHLRHAMATPANQPSVKMGDIRIAGRV